MQMTLSFRCKRVRTVSVWIFDEENVYKVTLFDSGSYQSSNEA